MPPEIGLVDVRLGASPETAERLQNSEIDIGLTERRDDGPGFQARV